MPCCAPLPVNADPLRIAQVFGNLLNNAARYGRRGGHVRLQVQRAPGREALVRVVDDGIGIEPDILPHVFELFTQGQSQTTHAHGLGIGLALVRSLVEQHGGRVSAASDGPGQGATFSVWLPLSNTHRRSAIAEPEVPAAPQGLRVLVVDDNQDAARTLGMALEASGISHQLAHDGPSALAAADVLSPDVVLLDLQLPDTTGFAVAEEISGEAAVVITSTRDSTDFDALARRSGARGFVSKAELSGAALEELLP